MSSKFERFGPTVRNSTPIIASIVMRIHIANPRPLDRFLRSIGLCFLHKKIINNVAIRHSCDVLMRSLGDSFRVDVAIAIRRWRH